VSSSASDWGLLRTLIFGGVRARLVYTAARLRIPDALHDGPLSTEEIARRTETHPDSLRHVLRALVADGVFEEVAPDRFALTQVGRLLVDDAAGSRRYDALLIGDHVESVFAHLPEAVRTGEPAADLAFGKPYFDWLSDNPEAATIFNSAMTLGAQAAVPTAFELELWTRAEYVVDVGGGNGTVLSALLRKHPDLRGTVFDLPHAERSANAVLAAAGVADRASFEAGSFFERVPAGADVYLAVQVLHNWAHDEAVRILQQIREVMSPQGRLLLIEIVVPTDDHSATAVADAMSYFWLGGGERTEPEWRELLAQGGFRIDRMTPGEWVSAIEAVPA